MPAKYLFLHQHRYYYQHLYFSFKYALWCKFQLYCSIPLVKYLLPHPKQFQHSGYCP